MSRYVEQGTFDVGLTGRDWVMENDSDVQVVVELIYSKVSQRPARWVLAVPLDSPVQELKDLKGKKIATELVNFTRRYFAAEGIPVDVEFSWGATEAKVIAGLCDAIVEVTETGATMRANGLRIVKELMQSNTQLIVNKKSWEDPWKREKIENISLLLQGALRAEDLVGVKMNVPEERLSGIISFAAQPECSNHCPSLPEQVVVRGDHSFQERGTRIDSQVDQRWCGGDHRVFAQ